MCVGLLNWIKFIFAFLSVINQQRLLMWIIIIITIVKVVTSVPTFMLSNKTKKYCVR